MGLRSDDFVGRLLFREYTRNNRYRESLYTVLTQSLYCVLRRRTNKARTNGSPGGFVDRGAMQYAPGRLARVLRKNACHVRRIVTWLFYAVRSHRLFCAAVHGRTGFGGRKNL